MVGFLPPLVQEAPISGLVTVASYTLGAAAGGAGLGAALGFAGHCVPAGARPAALLLFGLLALACAGVDAGLLRWPLPERRRQVPVAWLYNHGQHRGALLYGVCLGSGVVTYIAYAGFYPLLGWACLQGPAVGAAVLGLYALMQALPVTLAAAAALRGAGPPLDGARLSQPLLRRVVAMVTAALAVGVLVSLGGS
jgi:hypothetical protein